MANYYSVSVPITGYATITVKSDSEESAIALALKAAMTDEIENEAITDWNPHKQLVLGGETHQAFAEQIHGNPFAPLYNHDALEVAAFKENGTVIECRDSF